MLSKPKRVRSFGDDEPVGLRIVAAMSGELQQGPAKDPVVGRSDPIPIRPGAVGTTLEKKKKKKVEEEEEEDEEEEMEEEEELSESYTCVTVHVGGKVVRRRVYGSGSGSESVSECSGGGSVHKYGTSPGVLILESPVPLSVPMAKGKGDFFLSRCYLCRKKLHGLDIFMYRGEKAFCSVECRCEQILSDEHKEKCSSEALKNQDSSYSPSPSPYPSRLLFAAGVAAA